ncbi:hypothetical protein NQ318_019583, partial [Aromia moschata]
NEKLQISTTHGVVQGRRAVTYDGIEFWAYSGIPYAKPPLGNLRFRGPKPAVPWPGVLDARKDGQTCVETMMRLTKFYTFGNEDCLYLNVFTPQNPKAIKEYLPVLVWIYGGAFLEGNSSTRYYGPDNLMHRDVVVVTFNYRVGIFVPGDSASPGNYGLKDQNLALRWVQANIRRFGGDSGRGLFHGIIAMSGSTLCTFAYKRDARSVAFQVAEGLGLSTKSTKEFVSQLRKTDVARLKEISVKVLAVGMLMILQDGFPFNPVIESNHKDAFISENTYTLLESGRFNRVPVLIGVNSLEAIFFSKIANLTKPFTILFDISPGSVPSLSMNIKTPDERRAVGIAIKRHYFREESFLESTEDEILNYLSDDQFVRPIRKTIQLIWKYVPVHFYVFDYRSDYGLKGFEDDLKGKDGVGHSEELPFVWKGAFRRAPRGLDDLTVLRMTKFYSNFARTGNPVPERDDLFENITWPTVRSSRTIPYLKIERHLSVGKNFREEHMIFWDKIYERYGNRPYFVY